jgi:hypothetical protein
MTTGLRSCKVLAPDTYQRSCQFHLVCMTFPYQTQIVISHSNLVYFDCNNVLRTGLTLGALSAHFVSLTNLVVVQNVFFSSFSFSF